MTFSDLLELWILWIKAHAIFFAVLAALGVAALIVWLPIAWRDKRREEKAWKRFASGEDEDMFA